MGTFKHNAMIITGTMTEEAEKKVKAAHIVAKKLFRSLVTPIIESPVNNVFTFFIAPDGSKEGWDTSDEHDAKRKELADYIETLAYEDGSTAIQYVDVWFDEQNQAGIERTNPEVEDVD